VFAPRHLAPSLALIAACNGSEPAGIEFWLSAGSRHELVAIETLPAWRLLAADLEGDGTDELVAVQNDGVVVVRPDGEIVPLLALANVVAVPWHAGDLFALVSDRDGSSRLVHARCDRGATPCVERHEVSLPDHSVAFELIDLDRDGALDLLTRDGHGLAWSRGETDGGWGPFARFADAPSGGVLGDESSIAAGDIDGDGAIDVAAVDEERGVLFFLGAAARDHEPLVLGRPGLRDHLVVADVTGDGIDDLVADQLDETWVFHRADGLAREDVIVAGEGHLGVSVVGEIDEVPGRDLVLVVDGAPRIAKWIDGRWRLAPLVVSEPIRPFPLAVAAGDFDGDGRGDLAFARPATAYEW
jgi:hypothetical protein